MYTILLTQSRDEHPIAVPAIIYDDSGREPMLTYSQEEALTFCKTMQERNPSCKYQVFELVEVK